MQNTTSYQSLLRETIEILNSFPEIPISPQETSLLLHDLALDSIQLMELFSLLEDRYEIRIPLSSIERIERVGDIAKLLDASGQVSAF